MVSSDFPIPYMANRGSFDDIVDHGRGRYREDDLIIVLDRDLGERSNCHEK